MQRYATALEPFRKGTLNICIRFPIKGLFMVKLGFCPIVNVPLSSIVELIHLLTEVLMFGCMKNVLENTSAVACRGVSTFNFYMLVNIFINITRSVIVSLYLIKFVSVLSSEPLLTILYTSRNV